MKVSHREPGAGEDGQPTAQEGEGGGPPPAHLLQPHNGKQVGWELQAGRDLGVEGGGLTMNDQ